MKQKSRVKRGRGFGGMKSKSFVFLAWIILGLIIFGGASYALTVINDQTITSPQVNSILYVQAGNASDIQAKIDLCSPDGCLVIIPPGSYLQTSDITIKSNLTIQGSGYGTVIIKAGEDVNIISNSDASNVVFTDFTYIINGDVGTGVGYPFDFAGGNKFDNFHFNNLHLVNGSQITLKYRGTDLNVINCFFDNVFAGIIANNDSRANIIYDYKFINNKFTSSQPIAVSGEAIDVNLHYNEGSVLVTGNIFSNFSEQAIDCNDANCIITGNRIEMNRYSTVPNQGIQVSSQTNNSAIISNNIITGVNGIDSAILVNRVDDALIMGNEITGFNNTFARGIRIGSLSYNVRVSNNFMSNLSIGIKDETGSAAQVMLIGNQFTNVVNNTVSSQDTYSILDSNLIRLTQGKLYLGTGFISNDPWIYIRNNTGYEGAYMILDRNGQRINFTLTSSRNDIRANGKDFRLTTVDSNQLILGTNAADRITVSSTGNITIQNLTGTGNDYVCVSASGLLYRNDIACT